MAASRQTLIGLSLVPNAADIDSIRELTRVADQGGLDLLGFQDHPYQVRFLDTWALMAALLAQTSSIRIFPDVANLPLRPPAVLAKTAASLDLLSGGRFELGLGAGAFWDGVVAMGGLRRTPGESVEALEEAIKIIRLMWSGERSVSFDGRYYRIHGVHPGRARRTTSASGSARTGRACCGSRAGSRTDGFRPSGERDTRRSARARSSSTTQGRKPDGTLAR